jgi:undecaprenyl diphosphate synthase
LNSSAETEVFSGIDRASLPGHVAIIMDGNGRWAEKRLLNRIQGHEKGAETVRTIVRTCRELGIAHLTLYAFSTENWQRPKLEIEALMTLLKRFLSGELAEMQQNNIRLNALGQIERLAPDVREALHRTMRATETNTAMTLHLALSYGGRAEIVEMVRTLARKVKEGAFQPEQIGEELVARHLYTAGIPDPDLLIRTSGEMRISNFLLWQIAYSEFFVTSTLWPDFNRQEFLEILKAYQGRDRRYGRVGGKRQG